MVNLKKFNQISIKENELMIKNECMRTNSDIYL